ncbi:MAG TPA: ParA family protein [Gammaproteobacteria bacterium]|nr:ParA family protein [Gammaproteobacteria bacterium]
MKKIVVLNPKGGSGKTTIASNLAACYAVHGERPALMDLDPQASSMRWLRKRPDDEPAIHGIAAFETSATVTRSWQMRIPAECATVVMDTPAAVDPHTLPDLTRGVDAIIVPVMPSDIDIHATAKCIADLLLVAKIRRSERRIGIIANRVRSNTRVSQSLTRFLQSLDIPLIATLRDTQSYVRSAEIGIGVCEMPRWQVQQELPQWQQILSWLSAPRRSSAVNGTSAARLVSIERPVAEHERAPLAGLATTADRELDASA